MKYTRLLILLLWCMFSIQIAAQTTVKKPTTTTKKAPVAVKKKPAAATKKAPVAVKKKPAAVATKKVSTPKPVTLLSPTKCAELTKIAQIQCCLRERGYDPGDTDNTLNAKTRQALAQFQKDRYLPEGDLSIETMRALGVSK